MLISSKTYLKAGLYIVSMPIGNLKDITLRALEVLQSVDIIYCEDTRVTKKFLQLNNLPIPPLVRCDDHKQAELSVEIGEKIQNCQSIALVSDAGTPLISDPGYPIVSYLRDRGLDVYPIPGVSAAISALSVSGLPSHQFSFMGFVPAKKSHFEALINQIKNQKGTYIFYERPDRMADFLIKVKCHLPNVEGFIAREITKLHEEYYKGTIDQLIEYCATMTLKGEGVVIIAHYHDISSDFDIEYYIKQQLNKNIRVKEISKDPVLLEYLNKNDIYARAQQIKNEL